MRDGEAAEWDGLYGDHYRGSFESGEMCGVGKFNFCDGEEYLGCWLKPGVGQMPRRMSALKQRVTKAKAPLDSISDNLADHWRRLATLAEGSLEGAPAATEKPPAAQMPEAVHALRCALVRGGLDMLQTANGSTRASDSLSRRCMGQRERKANVVRTRIGRVGRAAANNPSAAAASQQKNPGC